MNVDKCPTCGARITINKANEYIRCPYCDSQTVNPYYKPTTRKTLIKANSNDSTLGELLSIAMDAIKRGEFPKATKYLNICKMRDPQCANIYIAELLVKNRLSGIPALASLKFPFDNTYEYRMAVKYGDSELVKQLIYYNNSIKSKHSSLNQANTWLVLNIVSIFLCASFIFGIIGAVYAGKAKSAATACNLTDYKKYISYSIVFLSIGVAAFAFIAIASSLSG